MAQVCLIQAQQGSTDIYYLPNIFTLYMVVNFELFCHTRGIKIFLKNLEILDHLMLLLTIFSVFDGFYSFHISFLQFYLVSLSSRN